GPSTAADGSLWYQVTIGDAHGYMLATYLSPTWTAPANSGTLSAAQPAPAGDAAAPAAPAAGEAAPATDASAPAAPAAAGGAEITGDTVLRASPTKDGADLGPVPAGAVVTP